MNRLAKRLLLTLGGLVALVGALLGWGFLIEPGMLVVARHDFALAHWPAEYPPLRVAVIGDLHAGAPFITLQRVDEIVARTNAAKPDLVVLLGDYIIQHVPGGHPIPIEPVAGALGRLNARLGTIAVLGNHDWWGDGARIRGAFQAAGITVLENRAVSREIDGHEFWVAGLADAITHRASFAQALMPVEGEPVIVLSHSPEPFAAMPPGPVIMLAAHTHGGQVRLPLIGSFVSARRVPHRWMAGYVHEDGRDLFVNTGIGTSILPVRFLTPPVIDVLDIHAPATAPAEAAAGG